MGFVECVGQSAPGGGVGRLKLQGLLKGGDGWVQFLLRGKDHAEIEMEGGGRGSGGDGFCDQIGGLIKAAGLKGDDAEEIEGVGMIRQMREDAAIDRLGPAEVAGLMGLHRLLEGFLELHDVCSA
jgi:hypothetical protein